jgi:hypothetical protein
MTFPHPETGELLETREQFLSALRAQEEKLSEIYRTLWPLRDGYAERFEAGEMPRPRHRTATQEKVARCPRCGGRLENEEGAA